MRRKRHNKRQPKKITLRKQKAVLYAVFKLCNAMFKIQEAIRRSQPVPSYIKGGIFQGNMMVKDEVIVSPDGTEKIIKKQGIPDVSTFWIDKQNSCDDFINSRL